MLEHRERELAAKRGRQSEMELAPTKVERSLDHSRARATIAARAYAALAENVRDYATFLLNTHGIITYWGESARRINGWTRAQATGAHLRLLYPSNSEDGTAEEHLRVATETGEYVGEAQRVRGDGSTFWAGETLTALRDAHGTLLGFAKLMRDITSQRTADALLQSAAESAEAARATAVSSSAAKSGFLAMMSHEIRTPVNAILGYHQLLDLEIKGPLTPAQREYVERASASGHHLLSLIDDVLDFSRIESTHAEIEQMPFEASSVVAAVLDLVMPQAYQRDVQIADQVSSAEEPVVVLADAGGTRQILLNLLTNAVKFTRARNDAPARVTVRARISHDPPPSAALLDRGQWACISVEDTGVGIEEDRQEEMFEPFTQADMSLTRRSGGTGLGLAISRRLARLMHGDITVKSVPGVGSTFSLWLPTGTLTDGTDEQAAQTNTAESYDTGGTLREIANIIMVETRRVLHAYVARMRSDPETASARAFDDARLEDHGGSFLADIAATLACMEGETGEREQALHDGGEIQRTVARSHGVQRARIGWSAAEVRRDFAILREEVHAAIRRRLPSRLYGPPEARNPEVDRARALIDYFFASSERGSLESHSEFTRGRSGHIGTADSVGMAHHIEVAGQ